MGLESRAVAERGWFRVMVIVYLHKKVFCCDCMSRLGEFNTYGLRATVMSVQFMSLLIFVLGMETLKFWQSICRTLYRKGYCGQD